MLDLSIVIPAFNEGRKIAADIKAAEKFIQRSNLIGQIIIVDDGSSDDTPEAAKSAAHDLASKTEVKLISYHRHRGKGGALRAGIAQTTGRFVMFADSGLCVPYENILLGLNLIKAGTCEIAHGSRKMQTSSIKRAQGFYRRVCSAIFHFFVVHLMHIRPELTDTQCGFKIYKGDIARSLYGECISSGFMFDIEIILRAQKKRLPIKEFPIQWTCDPDSRLSPSRSLWRIIAELATLKRTLKKQ
ncbi:MAG: glycosyltransferase [Sedimentisphaerales bacterium]|nr:glycosyltransferase [Sedimentisphaerales bacterium]